MVEKFKKFLNIPQKNSQVSFRPKKKKTLQIGVFFFPQFLKKKDQNFYISTNNMISVKAPKALRYNIYLFIYLLVLYILDEGTERRPDHTHVGMQRKA